jgi:hypothetical protein
VAYVEALFSLGLPVLLHDTHKFRFEGLDNHPPPPIFLDSLCDLPVHFVKLPLKKVIVLFVLANVLLKVLVIVFLEVVLPLAHILQNPCLFLADLAELLEEVLAS